MDVFESKGFWHLPEGASEPKPGTLRYSPEMGSILALMGSFGEAEYRLQSGKYPIIYGIVDASPYGKFFTLCDCFQTRISWAMPGFMTQDIRANYAYVGHRLITDVGPRFKGFRLRLTYLSDWVRNTGISLVPRSEKEQPSVRLDYKAPDPIAVGQASSAYINFSVVTSSSTSRSVSFREYLDIESLGIGEIELDEIQKKYIFPLQNLLTLAADTPSSIEDLQLSVVSDDSTDEHHLPEMDLVHFISTPIYKKGRQERVRSPHDMLFVLDDLGDDIPFIVDRWLGFSERFQSFCDVYFAVQYASGTYLDSRFLWLVNSVSLFAKHKQLMGPLGESALENLRELIQHSLADPDHTFVSGVLPSIHELNLPWYISELSQRNLDIMAPIIRNDVIGFAKDVVNTRNYVLNRDPALHAVAAQGAALHWLTEKLLTLLKACMLREIGFGSETLLTIFSRNHKYAHLKTV